MDDLEDLNAVSVLQKFPDLMGFCERLVIAHEGLPRSLQPWIPARFEVPKMNMGINNLHSAPLKTTFHLANRGRDTTGLPCISSGRRFGEIGRVHCRLTNRPPSARNAAPVT